MNSEEDNKVQVSVIIPTYKPKAYIQECLESIAYQTLDKSLFEVIIVLNGDIEPYLSYLQDILSNNVYQNFKLIIADKKGVSHARNLGLDSAIGNYIAFIDDDDIISDNYIENLLLKATENSIVLSNSISFQVDTRNLNYNYINRRVYYKLTIKKNITLFNARTMLNGTCMKLISKKIINSTRFDIHFKNGEDALFMYTISRFIVNVELAQENTIYYRRIRSDSAFCSNKSFKYILNNSFMFILSIMKVFAKNPTKYNLLFTLSRIIAPMKNIISYVKKLS